MSEVEKIREVKEQSQAIGNFIEEFLRGKGIFLAKYHKHTKECYVFGKKKFKIPQCGINSEQPISMHYNIEKLLAEYFKIDLNKAEEEKRKILEDLRKK